MFEFVDFLPAVSYAMSAFLAVDLHIVKVKELWQRVLLVAVFVIFAAVCTTIVATEGHVVLHANMILFAVAPLLVLGLALRKQEMPQFVFGFCFVAVLAHTDIIVPLLMGAFVPAAAGLVSLLVSVALAALVCALIHMFVAQSYVSVMDNSDSELNLTSLCIALGFAMLLSLLVIPFSDYKMMLVFDSCFTLYMLLMLVAQLSTLLFVRRELEKTHNLELFKLQAENHERSSEEHKKAEAEERRRRHDQRHALQVVLDELNDGNIQQAVSHLEKIQGSPSAAPISFCRNSAVNSVISTWVRRAEEKGIDVRVRADVPQELKVDAMELSTIMSNLLENAYEGCMRLERTETRRYINVRCNYTGGRFSCEIENSCRKDIVFSGGMPCTQKRGGGIGTRSVKATVENLGGLCSYFCENGVFKVRFVFAA